MRFSPVLIVMLPALAAAQPAPAARGLALARRDCGMCHALDMASPSRNAQAPPFRDLHKRFVVKDLDAGRLTALIGRHKERMPRFRLTPSEAAALVAYIQSVQGRGDAGSASLAADRP